MKDRIRAFMVSGAGRNEAAFDALALALCAWQRARNADYAAICGDARPRSWREIPAVPVGLFRDLALTCFPATDARIVFRTSGTTTGARGVHRLLDTEIYDLGARLAAVAVVGPIPAGGISLVNHDPDSSLGHMALDFAPGLVPFFSSGSGLDRAGALAALRGAREPVFVPATSFAMADLLTPLGEPPEAPIPLPPGSVVMITGGYKGKVRTLSEEALLRRIAVSFPGAVVVGEYGMTELSSQLWAAPLGAPYQPPLWMRVLAVDPATGEPAAEGQLRFFDLANHSTVLAIETQDLGVVLGDGRVVLRGRLPAATARGCSLTVEEASTRSGAPLG